MDSQRRLGILLVAVGVLALAVQAAGGIAWPWFVLAPGIALVALALTGFDADLALPGVVVTTVGAILLVQDATGTYHTWSYAWALVVAASGGGRALRGQLARRESDRRAGWNAMIDGLMLFVAFGVFFEFVIFRDDLSDVAAWGVPALLIVAGLYLAWRQRRFEPTRTE